MSLSLILLLNMLLSLFAPLFRFSFWFNLQTQPFSPWVSYLILGLILLCLGAGVYAFVQAPLLSEKAVRRVWRRMGTCLLSAAAVGFVLFFFTWQRIPVLGMRAFWPIWFVAHAAWGVKIVLRAQSELPALRQTQAKRQAYEKWLPKAKK